MPLISQLTWILLPNPLLALPCAHYHSPRPDRRPFLPELAPQPPGRLCFLVSLSTGDQGAVRVVFQGTRHIMSLLLCLGAASACRTASEQCSWFLSSIVYRGQVVPCTKILELADALHSAYISFFDSFVCVYIFDPRIANFNY